MIRISTSPLTIESCNGEAHDDSTTHTCALCVALNKTVFKNNNKPDYTHPHCRCIQLKYELTDVTEDIPFEKISDYLFVDEDKSAMMRSMGYSDNNAEYLYDLLSRTVKYEFLNGNYKLKKLNKNGQHFEINFKLSGIKDHIGEEFDCHIGCIAWPYGIIKVATPLIKD